MREADADDLLRVGTLGVLPKADAQERVAEFVLLLLLVTVVVREEL